MCISWQWPAWALWVTMLPLLIFTDLWFGALGTGAGVALYLLPTVLWLLVATTLASLETRHTYPERLSVATFRRRFARVVPYVVINTGMLPHQFSAFTEGLFGALHSEFERTPKAASVTGSPQRGGAAALQPSRSTGRTCSPRRSSSPTSSPGRRCSWPTASSSPRSAPTYVGRLRRLPRLLLRRPRRQGLLRHRPCQAGRGRRRRAQSGRSKPREKFSTAATVRYMSHTPVATWARPSSRPHMAEPRLAKKSQM